MMKKIIRLSESQIIKLVKHVISESELPNLTINQFSEISSKQGYELEDTGESIDYIGKNSSPSQRKKNNPKIELVVKFYKKPENQKYKVVVMTPDSDNDFGANLTQLIDDEIIKEFKKPENGGIDFGSSGKSNASPYGEITYYVEFDEFETFKNTVVKILNKYGV